MPTLAQNRKKVADLRKQSKHYRNGFIASLVITLFIFASGFKLPPLIIAEFCFPAICMMIGAMGYTFRKSVFLHYQAGALENSLGRPRMPVLVDEKVERRREAFTKRLEKIQFPEASIPDKYRDPVTHTIMNLPVFLDCGHNIDKKTLAQIKQNEEKKGVCPHPECQQCFVPKKVMPNAQLTARIEAYVALQEARAHARLFTALPELKMRLGLMKNQKKEEYLDVVIDIKAELKDSRVGKRP